MHNLGIEFEYKTGLPRCCGHPQKVVHPACLTATPSTTTSNPQSPGQAPAAAQQCLAPGGEGDELLDVGLPLQCAPGRGGRHGGAWCSPVAHAVLTGHPGLGGSTTSLLLVWVGHA